MARRTIATSEIQRTLTKTRIGRDLVSQIDGVARSRVKNKDPNPLFDVVIEFNRDFPGGTRNARHVLYLLSDEHRADWFGFAGVDSEDLLQSDQSIDDPGLRDALRPPAKLDFEKSKWTDSYLFAKLPRNSINVLASWTSKKGVPLVYKIWRDHEIKRCVYESVRTIKCDAAQASFGAAGAGIVWAVADTGIDGTHPHFKTLGTLDLPTGLTHRDFTASHQSDNVSAAAALIDNDGHGTHVAGIVAGRTVPVAQVPSSEVKAIEINSAILLDDGTTQSAKEVHEGPISGIAPYCKLVSLKVLLKHDQGSLSNLLAAIGFVQRSNDYGRNLKIHGLNLSLGYTFDPEWFAAGQSPLCVEIDRLVRSGVVVVVAAGNAGYGSVTQYSGASDRATHTGTIMDPGNAALAITVGSTHRDMPHSYGVSYFSSKGPTADGRMKPDIVAPGERIVSCALFDSGNPSIAPFKEDSGTSQATPHVSGAIAAFLSVRREFQGRPEQVKEIFVNSATDLKRRLEFQGAGLVDLMRALQSV